ncbi:hypothetical protein V2E24_02665 [Mycoplasmopsis ciconiae]|uniref:Uncharacterized protein n=1 Tax=Mycoplasmopsis ciconiae TaxID=561067 RepID=A0ABU7MLQ6_9BACT|nr:hypothetical protein [Mycoplasmopsis ciconiae]
MRKALKNKFIIISSTLATTALIGISAVSCAQKEENNKPNPTPETPAPNPGNETSTPTPTNEGSTTNPGNESSTPSTNTPTSKPTSTNQDSTPATGGENSKPTPTNETSTAGETSTTTEEAPKTDTQETNTNTDTSSTVAEDPKPQTNSESSQPQDVPSTDESKKTSEVSETQDEQTKPKETEATSESSKVSNITTTVVYRLFSKEIKKQVLELPENSIFDAKNHLFDNYLFVSQTKNTPGGVIIVQLDTPKSITKLIFKENGKTLDTVTVVKNNDDSETIDLSKYVPEDYILENKDNNIILNQENVVKVIPEPYDAQNLFILGNKEAIYESVSNALGKYQALRFYYNKDRGLLFKNNIAFTFKEGMKDKFLKLGKIKKSLYLDFPFEYNKETRILTLTVKYSYRDKDYQYNLEIEIPEGKIKQKESKPSEKPKNTETPKPASQANQEQLNDVNEKIKTLNNVVKIVDKEKLKKAIEAKKFFWYDYKSGNIIYSEKATPNWKNENKQNVILSASAVKELGDGYQLANSDNPTYKNKNKALSISTKISYEVINNELILTYKLAKYITGQNPIISETDAKSTVNLEEIPVDKVTSEENPQEKEVDGGNSGAESTSTSTNTVSEESTPSSENNDSSNDNVDNNVNPESDPKTTTDSENQTPETDNQTSNPTSASEVNEPSAASETSATAEEAPKTDTQETNTNADASPTVAEEHNSQGVSSEVETEKTSEVNEPSTTGDTSATAEETPKTDTQETNTKADASPTVTEDQNSEEVSSEAGPEKTSEVSGTQNEEEVNLKDNTDSSSSTAMTGEVNHNSEATSQPNLDESSATNSDQASHSSAESKDSEASSVNTPETDSQEHSENNENTLNESQMQSEDLSSDNTDEPNTADAEDSNPNKKSFDKLLKLAQNTTLLKVTLSEPEKYDELKQKISDNMSKQATAKKSDIYALEIHSATKKVTKGKRSLYSLTETINSELSDEDKNLWDIHKKLLLKDANASGNQRYFRLYIEDDKIVAKYKISGSADMPDEDKKLLEPHLDTEFKLYVEKE